MAAGVQKILIKRTKRFISQRFHSQLIADNGNVLWTSEKYSNIGACEVPAYDIAKRLNIQVEYDFDRKWDRFNQ